MEQVGLRASEMAGSVDFEAGSMAVRHLACLLFEQFSAKCLIKLSAGSVNSDDL